MAITFRTYRDDVRYGEDYQAVRNFLLALEDLDYPFGRWDWMISHSRLDASGLPKIGMWLNDGAVVGLALYDTVPDGDCFFPLRAGYGFLYGEMITYAEQHFAKEGYVQLLIRDGDVALQHAALKMGYHATQRKDSDATFVIEADNTRYSLPEGFTITSMKETYDVYQYGRVLWNGFNHELNGEGPYAPTLEKLALLKGEFERPNVDLDLKIAVVAPDGSFVSYCGMWQNSATEIALVEPVATDPAYRRMGLGRAAVLEGIRRCGRLGAKKASVGSSQQFYYSIGFGPCGTSTFWAKKSPQNSQST